jgi:hypothetical protein
MKLVQRPAPLICLFTHVNMFCKKFQCLLVAHGKGPCFVCDVDLKAVWLRCEFSSTPVDHEHIAIIKESSSAQRTARHVVETLQARRDKAEDPQFSVASPFGKELVEIEHFMTTVYSGTVAGLFPGNCREVTAPSGQPYTLLILDVAWKDVKEKEKVSCRR